MTWKHRDYQQETIDKVRTYIEGGGRCGYIIAPTGSGKASLQAQFALDAIEHGGRVLSTVHTRELVEQNAKTIGKVRPGTMVGIYSAGLNSREFRADTTVAGIQSVFRKPNLFGKISVLIIDEVHLARATDGMYAKLIKGLRERNPDLVIIGLSATVFFDLPELKDRIHSISTRMLIEQGYLSRMITKKTATKMKVEGVKVTAGDYNEKALAAAVDHDEITRGVVDDALKIGVDRKSALIFGVGVEHAKHLADEFNRRGKPCGFVCGDTPSDERDETLRKFKAGEYWGVSNAGVLTTGFDHPPVDLIVLARPTRSPVLYSQICGRGMRPVYAAGADLSTVEGRLAAIRDGGKPNCLIADYGGVVQHLGPVDLLDENIEKIADRKAKRDKSPMTRYCQQCDAAMPIKETKCPECGHEEIKAPANGDRIARLSRESGGGAVVSDGTVSCMVRDGEDVASVATLLSARVHENSRDPSKPDTVRLMLATDHGSLSIYLCPAHGGAARSMSEKWWRKAGLPGDMPWTARACIAAIQKLHVDEWSLPRYLRIKRDGSWVNVTGSIFRSDYEIDDVAGLGGKPQTDAHKSPAFATDSAF